MHATNYTVRKMFQVPILILNDLYQNNRIWNILIGLTLRYEDQIYPSASKPDWARDLLVCVRSRLKVNIGVSCVNQIYSMKPISNYYKSSLLLCVCPSPAKKSDFYIITGITRRIGSSYCDSTQPSHNLKQPLEISLRVFSQFSLVSLYLWWLGKFSIRF